jgi:hypothetical protein
MSNQVALAMNTDRFPHISCVWNDPRDWDSLNAADVPDEPGYYAFTNYTEKLQPSSGTKEVLYVGIAAQSLRDRIRKYKTGDTSNLMHLHKGGFFMLISRAAAAHAEPGRVTQTVIRKPIEVIIKPGGGEPEERRTILPNAIYLRWAVDYRAAIEALLIRQLSPKYNTMLVQE